MRFKRGFHDVGSIILILLLAIFGIVHGEESDLESNEVFYPQIKVPTCCAIDLDLANSSCKSPIYNQRIAEWTFPWQIMAENVSTKFPLQVKKIQCKSGPPKKIYLSMLPRMEGSYKLLKNGYLKVDKEFYPPSEYCINGIDDTEMEFIVCPQDCGGSRPCIKKCCSLDKVYNFAVDKTLAGKKGCQTNTGEYWKPTFYDDYTTRSSDNIPEPYFLENYPSDFKLSCPQQRMVFYLFPNATSVFNEAFNRTFHGLMYRIRKDGKVIFKHQKDGKCSVLESETEFCIDGAINYGRPDSSSSYVNNEQEIVLFQCILETPDTSQKKLFGLLYGGIMLASSVFLLLTIATYIALWDRQSVHGWTIVSHTVSLFFMYIFLGLAHIIGVTSAHDYLGSPGCIGIGIITHFFFLSTFCWLFLISVDLWLTFRAFTPRSGTRSKGVGRYIKYSIFGWGVPAIIVIVGIILEDKYPEDECHTLLTPAYGKDSCFPQQKALGVYLYYPIAVMIFFNVIFYLLTTFKLYLYRESTKLATKDDKQTDFYRLFLKLFFIMGVLWVFEVISWATSGEGYHWYWILFDMLNVLRALAVFIIFVCKRDIIFSLEEKYPCLKPVLLPFAWLFQRKPGAPEHDSTMTRTSTLRQTISSDGKPESIGLIVNTK